MIDIMQQAAPPAGTLSSKPCAAHTAGRHNWHRPTVGPRSRNLRPIGITSLAICRACGQVRSEHKGRSLPAYWTPNEWLEWLKPRVRLPQGARA